MQAGGFFSTLFGWIGENVLNYININRFLWKKQDRKKYEELVSVFYICFFKIVHDVVRYHISLRTHSARSRGFNGSLDMEVGSRIGRTARISFFVYNSVCFIFIYLNSLGEGYQLLSL
jgi:hypothetical protein